VIWRFRPTKTSLLEKSRDSPFQGSPDILDGNNIFFYTIGLSYDCHVRPVLLSIPSLSPHDEWSNWLRIKGKRAMLPSDAEKSMLGKAASIDV